MLMQQYYLMKYVVEDRQKIVQRAHQLRAAALREFFVRLFSKRKTTIAQPGRPAPLSALHAAGRM